MGVKAAVNAVKKSEFKWVEHPKSENYGEEILVSAESGDGAADYYGEFRGGSPWINPKLEEIAKKNGCYWEWLNPGAIGLYPN